jgi:hypothetical protein
VCLSVRLLLIFLSFVLTIFLSLSLRTEDRHRRLPSFSLSFFFYLLPAGKGYVSGEEMLAGCGKDGKGRKEKSRGEKESEREPVPKTG